eukprot:COSAG01_NODE_63695_length_279_cov_0.572222_1_plen_59_part_01
MEREKLDRCVFTSTVWIGNFMIWARLELSNQPAQARRYLFKNSSIREFDLIEKYAPASR